MDKDLFEEIYNKNRDRVYRLCCLYSGDPDTRKDLVQDIFLRVWENLSSFRGDAAVSTWIYRIALNTCLIHKRTIRKNHKVQSIPPKFDVEDIHEPNNGDHLNHLIHCVNKLPPLDRSIISLYLEDLPGKEISEIIGLSEANIRVKIHRIKEQLNEMINKLNLKSVNYEYR